MAEGYEDDQTAPLDDGMDEFLCEYVDGAMDPVVLKAFEEYLRANPEVAEHVQCLCQAKRFLAEQGSCSHSTGKLQMRLREAIAREQLGSAEPAVEARLGSVAWLTSAAGLMLMLGVLFGTAMVNYQASDPGQAVVMEREAAPSDAHPLQAARLPQGARASLSVVAPVMALPSLRSSAKMTPLGWNDSLRTAALYP